MRIIAGTARGVPIQVPKGRDVRPTLDRVRESVFNILTPDLEPETHFADLFCGTGANGLEALSRGVASVVFVDANAESLSCARANAEKTKLSDCARFTRASIPERLSTAIAPLGRIDVIYADPPFAYANYEELLGACSSLEALPHHGLVVVEHSSRVEIPQIVGELTRFRVERYGETSVSFYQRNNG